MGLFVSCPEPPFPAGLWQLHLLIVTKSTRTGEGCESAANWRQAAEEAILCGVFVPLACFDGCLLKAALAAEHRAVWRCCRNHLWEERLSNKVMALQKVPVLQQKVGVSSCFF